MRNNVPKELPIFFNLILMKQGKGKLDYYTCVKVDERVCQTVIILILYM